MCPLCGSVGTHPDLGEHSEDPPALIAEAWRHPYLSDHLIGWLGLYCGEQGRGVTHGRGHGAPATLRYLGGPDDRRRLSAYGTTSLP